MRTRSPRRKDLRRRWTRFLADAQRGDADGREGGLARRARALQQTEAYRFGNAIVDDWEGKVNAWPLDEGLIDYVDAELRTATRTRTCSTSPT